MATARLIAVVVLPTPPFWLTIASTRPTLRLWFLGDGIDARPQFVERHLCMTHPSLRLGAGWRLREECLEMFLRTDAIVPLEQEKGEPIVRARELRRDLQGPAIASHGIVETACLRERDRHVLQDLWIVRPIPQREPIRRQRRVVVALPLQCQRLAQVIETLWLHAALGFAADQAAPPGH